MTKTWQFVIPAGLTANGMDGFSGIGILLQTKPQKKRRKKKREGEREYTQDIRGHGRNNGRPRTKNGLPSVGVSGGSVEVFVTFHGTLLVCPY